MTDKIVNGISGSNLYESPLESLKNYRNALYKYSAPQGSIFTESRLNEAKQHLRSFIDSGNPSERTKKS